MHASWLTQCEIYFSETSYNAVAKPFHWTFGRDDLDKLLARLDRHRAA